MERVTDEELATDVASVLAEKNPNEDIQTIIDYVLDLRDARAEIKRLKELSASQAEALEKMSRGEL